jgi:hypothetical protein
MDELTLIKLCPFLLKVVMSHAEVIPSRSVELRNQVQPQRHLVATIVVPHLWPQSCNIITTESFLKTRMLANKAQKLYSIMQ